jgi:hypothetical protein
LADASSEKALIDAFRGNTYRLIDQGGALEPYFVIISSAAQALAKLNTDTAFNALVSKVRQNARGGQVGLAATVYGLSFSPRAGVEDTIRSIERWRDAASGNYLPPEIDKALHRIKLRRQGWSDQEIDTLVERAWDDYVAATKRDHNTV